MSPKLSPDEAILIISVLEKTILKLSVFQSRFQNKIHENNDLRIQKKFCDELGQTNKIIKWIKRMIQVLIEELNNNRYDTIVKIVQEKTNRDKCEQLAANIIEEEETESESSGDEEALEFDRNIDMCVCNTVTAYDNLAHRMVKAKNETSMRISKHLDKIARKKREVTNEMKTARRAREVEEKVWDIKRNFLEQEKIDHTAETEAWYKRFYEEKDELYESIVRLREDIETLKDSFLVVEDDVIRKQELLEEFYKKSNARGNKNKYGKKKNKSGKKKNKSKK